MFNESDYPYELPEKEGIYEILIGDTECGPYRYKDDGSYTRITMPKMNAVGISGLAKDFGLELTVSKREFTIDSAFLDAEYMGKLIRHCVTANRCSEFLEKLFDIHRFYAFKGHTPAATEDAYRVYKEKIIEKINGYLYVDKAEMVYVKDRYVVRKIADRANPVERATERVDVGYIEEAKKEVLDFIDRQQYNEAIGAACKLLESVFVYICDRHKIKKSKDMRSKYYNQIVKLYDICPQNETDRKLQDLMEGLNKLINSISDLRNEQGKMHAVGEKEVEMEEHHAILCLNAAITLGEFFLSLDEKQRDCIFEEKK